VASLAAIYPLCLGSLLSLYMVCWPLTAGKEESFVSQIMGLLMLVLPFLVDSGLRRRLMGTLPPWPLMFCSFCLVRYRRPHALQSVPLPNGPVRHSGVESVPQC
jgi:hypothetical protein